MKKKNNVNHFIKNKIKQFYTSINELLPLFVLYFFLVTPLLLRILFSEHFPRKKIDTHY